MKQKVLLRLSVLFLGCAVVLVALLFCGCAAMHSAKAGSVNQNITVAIADAGTVANQAEQMYQTKQIPQTDAVRNSINGLGAAYNESKAAYLVLLTAEAVYQGTQNQQIMACTPTGDGKSITSGPGSCADATQKANSAKAQLDSSQSALNGKVSTMVSKTSAVKTITTHAKPIAEVLPVCHSIPVPREGTCPQGYSLIRCTDAPPECAGPEGSAGQERCIDCLILLEPAK
jgi:ABC-type Na+ efflux pump permease subunit